MRFRLFVVCLFVSITLTISANAQNGVAQRDTSAVGLLTGVAAKSGWGSANRPQDLIVSGKMTGRSGQSHDFVLKWRAPGDSALLIDGMLVTVARGGAAAVRRNGVLEYTPAHVVDSLRGWWIPIASDLGRWDDNSLCAHYAGADSALPGALNVTLGCETVPKLKVSIDSSFSVVRLSYRVPSANNPYTFAERSFEYSDFRTVGKIVFPFAMKERFHGTPAFSYTVSSVTLDNGLTDTDFQLPENAQ